MKTPTTLIPRINKRSFSIISIFFILLTMTAKGQHYELLGKTEAQVLQKTKDFKTIEKQLNENGTGSIIFLENPDKKLRHFVYFNTGAASYKVVTIAPKQLIKDFRNTVDKSYNQLDKNTWRSQPVNGSTVEIEIREADDEVIFSVSKIALANIDDKKIMPRLR
jgi:hypothetical protein